MNFLAQHPKLVLLPMASQGGCNFPGQPIAEATSPGELLRDESVPRSVSGRPQVVASPKAAEKVPLPGTPSPQGSAVLTSSLRMASRRPPPLTSGFEHSPVPGAASPASPASPKGGARTTSLRIFRQKPLRCSIEEACRGEVEDMGEAKLCLPTVRSTLLSALLVSGMIFIGLVALSASEVGIFGQKMGWLTLLLRLVGWLFLFYIPIHFISMPFTRNFVLWSLQPGEKLTRARSYVETPNLSARRANCLPYVIHTAWISAYTLLVCVHIGEKEHFGFIPIYGLGNLLMMPIGIVTTLLLAPPTVSRRYAFSIGPATLLLPILGFLIVVTSYSLLRRSLGPQLGLVIPLILSFYELLGTSLVSRIFTKQFVIQPEVREGYTGTNQGIVVSMAICNLHAMAEGARLTLLYVDHVQNQDLTILMPIISGVLWNVMARLGGLDRLLHIITRGWRRPNNSSKLLRESGYCVGYLRFGAVGAMLLARLCNGVPVPLNGPEMIIVLSVLLAEAVEDLLSYALWYIGVDFSPPSLLVTEQEVEAMATTRLSKRKGSKEPTRRSSSKESSSSVVPTLPTPTPTPASLPHSARGRTAPLPDPHGGPPPRPLSPSSPKSPKPDRTLMKSTCWSTRVAYDFRFRIEEFEKMPFWGHLLPAAMAQFHTIFAMIIFSQGLDHMLGFCTEADSGFTYDSAIFWWPIQYPKC